MGQDDVLDDATLVHRLLLPLLVSRDATSASGEAERLTCQRQAAALMATCRRWQSLLEPQSRAWRATGKGSSAGRRELKRRPAVQAVTPAQRASISHAVTDRVTKEALFSEVTLENRANYFRVSCRPITKRAEDDMELLSDLSTWGERFLHCWQPGTYVCARCARPLYGSRDKWSGPCPWPSWRKPVSPDAISETWLAEYNHYACAVAEVYCGGCDLFLGHKFEDARGKGDAHPDAHWRH